MIIVLALVALNVLLLLDPVVALLAKLEGVKSFGSEVPHTLVLELVVLDEIVDADAELLGAEVGMMFAKSADFLFQAFFEGKLLLDIFWARLGTL